MTDGGTPIPLPVPPEDDFAAADRAWWRRYFPETPDMGRLIRHAERYGSDGVGAA